MEKIGILTYHYSINEGAMLQTYALLNTCRKLFPEYSVEVVDIIYPGTRKRDLKNCFAGKFNIRSLLLSLYRVWILNKWAKKNLNLSKEKHLVISYEKSLEFLKKQKYDVLVVGSDEIWKVQKGKKVIRSFPNIYWLGSSLEAKKISYAASANKTNIRNISKDDAHFIKQNLNNFNHISVRDNFTFNLVKDILPSKKIVKVLDPTFLYDFSEFNLNEKKLKKFGFDFNKKTLLLNIKYNKISKVASDYFREKGWQIVSVSNFNKHADINFLGNFTPEDWVSLYKKIDFVITDRFHGTIFSIKNEVPFISVWTTEKNKILDLLKRISLDDFFFFYQKDSFYDKDFLICCEDSSAQIKKRFIEHTEALHNNREDSMNFLKNINIDNYDH